MEAPHNVEFERRVLGFALRNTEAREEVISRLRPADFYDTDNATVFEILTEKAHAGQFLDAELLIHELSTLTGPARASNDPHDLAMSLLTASGAMTSAAVPQYVEILRNLGKGRDLMATGTRLLTEGSTADGTSEAISAALQRADEEIRDVIDRNVDATWSSVSSIIADFDGNPVLQPLFPSGLADLDRVLQGGFRAGQFIAIAARPAMGKTTLAMDIAQHASIRKGVPGLVISLEMGTSEIAMRIIAGQGRVAMGDLQQNRLSDEDHDIIDSITERFKQTPPPLYIEDNVQTTWPDIRAEIIAAYRRLGIKYVVIDYLQLITGDGSKDGRTEVVSNISRQIKGLARSLGIVIFVVSQLNRKSEERTNHRPMLSDLRESGQIEQDADMVLFIHRPEVYDSEDRQGEADLIVGKHRNGETGDVPVLFMGHYSTFTSMAREDTYAPSA